MPVRAQLASAHGPKVVVCESSSLSCQLLADTIQRGHHLRVVGLATNNADLISAVQDTEADIAVIGTELKNGINSGIIAVQQLRGLHPRPRTILLLPEERPELVVQAFRAGTEGVCCRNEISANLRKSVQSVYRGEIWVNGAQLEYIVEALMQVPAPNLPSEDVTAVLTKREQEVARLVAAGMSNREVSQELGLSQHSVKNYLFHVYQKLGISSRVELLLYVLSQRKQPETDDSAAPQLTYQLIA